jgi:hypothetical protein
MSHTPLGRAYAEEQITVSSAVKTFTEDTYDSPPNGNKPAAATFSVKDDNIRVKFTGNPTSTIGLLLNAGEKVTVIGQADIIAFKAIRETTDAIIDVVYYY